MKDRAMLFHQHRSRLYGIAYRMLGSRADAEDMIQEAYLRWHRVEIERIHAAEAWLVTTITRLCIDRLRLNRAERASYVGTWLPEPLSDTAPPSDARYELASDLSVAFLVVLERLGPEERVAFLLREIFDSKYAEIAQILGKNEAACRQIVHRAKSRVRQERPRFKVSEAARANLLERFLDGLRAQDHAALLWLFADDVTWMSDGGGKIKASRNAVRGAELVSRQTPGLWGRHLSRLTHRLIPIDGEAGIVTFDSDHPVSVVTIDTDGLRILAAFAVLNPDEPRAIPREGAPA